MENLPRNSQTHPPASLILDDLLNLLVDLDVSSQGTTESKKSNIPAPTTSQNSPDGDHGNRSVNDCSSTPEPSPDPEDKNSSPKVSNLITAHRQSLLKSLSLPTAPVANSTNSSTEIDIANSSENIYSSIHNHQINNLEISDIAIPKPVTLATPKPNSPKLNPPQPNDSIHPEITHLQVEHPKVNYPQTTHLEVEHPKVNYPEIAYSKIEHPKLDYPEVAYSEVAYSKSTNTFDSTHNNSINGSENSSINSSINSSKDNYFQSPPLTINDTTDISANLGLLMDLTLSSPPIKNPVEMIAIPEIFLDTSSLISGGTLPEILPAQTLEPLLELVLEPNQGLEVDEDPLDILQRLLVNPDVYDAQKLLQGLEVSLRKLESQIYEPEKLIELLLPTIADVLSMKISQSKEEVVEAITPIIDEVIQHRIEQDRVAMSGAIAPIISEAISKQILDSPEEIANAIGPTMGKAIQEQIRLEKDSMVDALYPIIGSTISKYMGEAIDNINRQVETAFSAEGLKRKVQAKIQGVSEAELILREALPFKVLAVFLIHKSSGLLIADAQPPQEQQLEADMIAGMLTAIRSFANDCMTTSNTSPELNQIDYSDSKIVLEVAGYCYLALVIRGQMTEGFVKKFRRSMSTIVRIYNRPIMNFEGDRSTIPEEVNTLIEDMITYNDPDIKPTSRYPLTLGFVILAAISIVMIPLGIYQYRQSVNNQIAAQVVTALDKTPELSVYRLEAQVIDNKVKLIGKVPNSVLQKKAETIAHQVETKLAIDNQIIAVDIPVDSNFTVAEIQRTTMVLNENPGIAISSRYQAGVLEIIGIAKDEQSINNVTKIMQNIPGIKVLSNRIQLRDISQEGILRHIYFEAGSVTFPPASLSQITEIKNLLTLSPNFRLRIIGYADNIGDPLDNKGLATARAISVQQILLEQGIEKGRLEIRGSIKQIPGITELWQNRFVEFELIAPNIQN